MTAHQWQLTGALCIITALSWPIVPIGVRASQYPLRVVATSALVSAVWVVAVVWGALWWVGIPVT